MTEDDTKTKNEAVADIYEAAARTTAEPIKFEDDETTDTDTNN